jgi:hypothetical protein
MLFKLASSLHHEELKLPFEPDAQWVEANQVVAVLTGGSEALFLEKVNKGEITLDKPIYLIAGEQSNSLAACCEILSWINQHNGNGQIRTHR